MSTDYFLFSRKMKRSVMVGSSGFSGVQSYPGHEDVVSFVRWAIENGVDDVVLIDEHALEVQFPDRATLSHKETET